MEQTENQSLSSLQDPDPSYDLSDTQMKQEEDVLEHDMTLETFDEDYSQALCWNLDLPIDIVVFIFKYLDCKSLAKTAMTNQSWYELYTSKEIQNCFKIEWFDIF